MSDIKDDAGWERILRQVLAQRRKDVPDYKGFAPSHLLVGAYYGSEGVPETITADADQSLSFEDLVNAYDKISKPTTAIDVPLPYDPDDFSVV